MNNKIDNQFGDRLRKCRDERKLSQEELAEELELSANTISNLENGKPVKLDSLIKIADYFNVSLDFLMFGLPNRENDVFIKKYERLSKEQKEKMLVVLNTFFPEI